MSLDDAIAHHASLGGPTDLYRYYNPQGMLLYVGISKSAVVRAMQHERTARWWDAWSQMTRTRYSSRDEALAAESTAIRGEAPLFNVLHVARPAGAW